MAPLRKVEYKMLLVPQPKPTGLFASCIASKPPKEIKRIEVITPSPMFQEGARALGLAYTNEHISQKLEEVTEDVIDFERFRRFLGLADDAPKDMSDWRGLEHVSMATGTQYRGFIHSLYGSCVVVSTDPSEPMVYRASKIERAQRLTELAPGTAQSEMFEAFRQKQLTKYGDAVAGDEFKQVIALLDAASQGEVSRAPGPLEPGQVAWGCWDCLVQPHSAVLRGRAVSQMRCVFLTSTGFSLFARSVPTVVVERGEAEAVDRVTALQRLADQGLQVRNVGRLTGSCLYVESTGLSSEPVELSEVRCRPQAR